MNPVVPAVYTKRSPGLWTARSTVRRSTCHLADLFGLQIGTRGETQSWAWTSSNSYRFLHPLVVPFENLLLAGTRRTGTTRYDDWCRGGLNHMAIRVRLDCRQPTHMWHGLKLFRVGVQFRPRRRQRDRRHRAVTE